MSRTLDTYRNIYVNKMVVLHLYYSPSVLTEVGFWGWPIVAL